MKKNKIYSNASIKTALEKLDKEEVGTLIVIDKDDKFLGTLSNGDLRRAILISKNINQKITLFYNKESVFFTKDEFSLETIRKILLKEKFDFIPILNNSKKNY